MTHEVNPILPMVDRILYLVDNRWAIGTPDDILTSARLSDLYQTDVEVLRVRGQIVIVGAPERPHAEVGSAEYHHVSTDEVLMS